MNFDGSLAMMVPVDVEVRRAVVVSPEDRGAGTAGTPPEAAYPRYEKPTGGPERTDPEKEVPEIGAGFLVLRTPTVEQLREAEEIIEDHRDEFRTA